MGEVHDESSTLEMAEILFERRDYAACLEMLEAALGSGQASDTGTWWLAGKTYRALNRYWLSADAYERAAESAPDNAELAYECGDAQERMQQYISAEGHFRRACDLDTANWLYRYRLGWLLERSGRPGEARAEYEQANDLYAAEFGTYARAPEAWHLRFGRAKPALDAAVAAAESDPSPEALELLGRCYEACFDFNHAARAWSEAAACGSKSEASRRHLRAGRLYEQAELWTEAVGSYRRAVHDGSSVSGYWSYRLAYALVMQGNPAEAVEQFRRSRSTHLPPKVAGRDQRTLTPVRRAPHRVVLAMARIATSVVGRLSSSWGRRLALACSSRLPNRGEWLLRVAWYSLNLDDCSDAARYWKRALIAFSRDVHGYPADGSWLSRLVTIGSTEPSSPTAAAIEAIALEQLGRTAEARQNYGHLRTFPEWGHEAYAGLGRCLLAEGNYGAAAIEFGRAADRRVSTGWREEYLAACAYAQHGDMDRAIAAFLRTRTPQRATGVTVKKLSRSSAESRRLRYASYRQELPIRRDLILYESFGGQRFGCNPLAISRHILARESNDATSDAVDEFTHVVVVDDIEGVPLDIYHDSRTVLVARDTDAYIRALATAHWLINNSTFPGYFSRRPGQLYLNTWHGIPHKAMGRHRPDGYGDTGNISRNLLHATHILSTSREYENTLLDAFDVAGLVDVSVIEAGYPRIQAPGPGNRPPGPADGEVGSANAASWLADVSVDRALPSVLYAPTWRGRFGDGSVPSAEFDAIRALSDLEVQVVYRPHYAVQIQTQVLPNNVAIVPPSIDTNDLLPLIDVLVTDYSSVWFDFLVYERPIVHHLYDEKEYESGIGTYLTKEDLPGAISRTPDELVEAVHRAAAQFDENRASYRMATQRFLPHQTECAAEIIVQELRREDVPGRAEMRKLHRQQPAILFSDVTLWSNGITSSFVNLVHLLAKSGISTSTIVDKAAAAADPMRISQLAAVASGTRILGRTSESMFAPRELQAVRAFSRASGDLGAGHRSLLDSAYAEEFVRHFGHGSWAAGVVFGGYSSYWGNVIGRADRLDHKCVFLHADLRSEIELKYPQLSRVVASLPRFDCIVSVSEAVSDLNRRHLSETYGVGEGKFAVVPNSVSCERIRRLAELDLRGSAAWNRWEAMVGRRLLTVGRLSPEKDHRKLLQAMRVVRDRGLEFSLAIIGGGPLERSLQQLTVELGLDDGSVCFLGTQDNPFPFVASADAFVLSSNHEGQPMVLLEALVLNRRIVATEIPGVTEMLRETGALLARNSVDGLAEALARIALSTQAGQTKFDCGAYNEQVLERFVAEVLDSRREPLSSSP